MILVPAVLASAVSSYDQYTNCVILFSVTNYLRPLARPRRRWVDNIKMDFQDVGCGCTDWIELAQDRDRWWARVNEPSGSIKCGEFS